MNEFITIKNAKGTQVELSPYGASINRVQVAMKSGELRDVVLYCDDLSHLKAQTAYAGATVGRYANRIHRGRFQLNGIAYQTSTNHEGNTLHGGKDNLSHRDWTVKEQGSSHVTFWIDSPNNDQGFPGSVQLEATFQLFDDQRLVINYRATCSEPTPINITAHPYFCLGPHELGVTNHQLRINAEQYYPIDRFGIPTSDPVDVNDTCFDLRSGSNIHVKPNFSLGDELPTGYDHCFKVSDAISATPKQVASLVSPDQRLQLDISSNMPALQVYSGYWLKGTQWGLERIGEHQQGFGIEPQFAPDSPNQPHWPNCIYSPERPYHHQIEYRFIEHPC